MRTAAALQRRALALAPDLDTNPDKARARARWLARRLERAERTRAYQARHPEGDVRDLRAWAWQFNARGWRTTAGHKPPPHSFAAGLDEIEQRRTARKARAS